VITGTEMVFQEKPCREGFGILCAS